METVGLRAKHLPYPVCLQRGSSFAMAQYIAEMLDPQHPQEAQKAQIISDRIRNEGLGV